MDNKILIIATCQRSFLDLKNVVLELKNRNIQYFFLYTNNLNVVSPRHNIELFNYDSNLEIKNKNYFFNSLGFELPFKPDILLITKENWEPEKSILLEFKQCGTFIACIENSSWIHNNIKTKLEIASRKSYPSNCIDIFFDHSEWCKETKILAGWWKYKSIVVGNPKYDNFDLLSTNNDENIIIIYGSMENEHHYELISIYDNIKSNLNNWDIYYKPHPNELRDFPNDFKNINLIIDHDNYLNILKKSKYNIGLFTSVLYLPLILNKNIVYIDQNTSGISKELNLENFKGHEFNFWKNILNFKEFKEFSDFISEEFIYETLNRNKILEKNILENLIPYNKNLDFLNKISNNKNLLKYYDEFNDQKASKRIVDFLEKFV